MKKFLIVLGMLVPVALSASFIYWTGNDVVRVQRAYPLPAQTLVIAGPRVHGWMASEDTCSKYAFGVLLGMGYSFTDCFYIGGSVPFYYDRQDNRNGYDVVSKGTGDVRVDFKFTQKINDRLYFGVNPFITLLAGEQRTGSSEVKGNIIEYEGGIFRDFTTEAHDYGLMLALSWFITNKLQAHFNAGGINSYQMPYIGETPNVELFGAAIEYTGPRFNPFLEVHKSLFLTEPSPFRMHPTKKSPFGNGPLWLTAGLGVSLFGGKVKIKGAFDYPLFDRGNVQLVHAPFYPSYPGHLNLYPNFTPNYGIDLNCEFAFSLPPCKAVAELGNLIVKVMDAKTQTPIPGASVVVEEKALTTNDDGICDCGAYNPGIFTVQASKEDYLPQEKFANIRPDEVTEVVFPFKKDKFLLKVNVVDGATHEGLETDIDFPGTNITPKKTDTTGKLDLELKRGFYVVHAQKESYIEGSGFAVPQEDQDEFEVTISLYRIPTAGDFMLPIIYFDWNKYKIKPKYFSELAQVARVLRDNPSLTLEISGHCCACATERYNRKLGLNRCNTVKRYLVNKFKINPSRLVLVSHGETKPAVPEFSSHETTRAIRKAHALNRRTEFRVIGR
ncbi:OmpA family protein [candidate division WOR-3 bacterium]|nr:OmpA family protein [candidate division WOR-3 bacterium]